MRPWHIILPLLGLAIVCGLVWYGILHPSAASPSPTAVTKQTPGRAIPDGMLEYRTQPYHFSLLYQKGLSVHEYGGGGGAHTIVFEGDESGFQVFVIPYQGTTVSNERFTSDIPSGVIKNQTQVTIGGVSAMHFASTDAALGDTTQVWFIHDGFLYEVTARAADDTALAATMATWQFIN